LLRKRLANPLKYLWMRWKETPTKAIVAPMRLFLVFIFFFLAGCSKPEPLYNTQSYIFGTLVDITFMASQNRELKKFQIKSSMISGFA